MSASDDWSHDVDPMPSMEPSSDLFDGDILGDELIDIYNAAVVGGSDDDTMDGKIHIQYLLQTKTFVIMNSCCSISSRTPNTPC